METHLRPSTTPEILDRSIHLWRQNFLHSMGICLAPAVLVLAFTTLVSIASLGRFSRNPLVVLVGAALYMVVYAAGCGMASGAMAQMVTGESSSLYESYAGLWAHKWRILGILSLVGLRMALVAVITFVVPTAAVTLLVLKTSFVRGVAREIAAVVLGLSYLFLILAGLVWMVHGYARHAFAVPICVMEGKKVREALRRSRTLVKGSLRRVWMVLFCGVLIYTALELALALPAIFIDTFEKSFPAFYKIWFSLADFIAALVAAPIITLGVVSVYYDQRVRKEAFDLELLMRTAEATAPPSLPAVLAEPAAAAEAAALAEVTAPAEPALHAQAAVPTEAGPTAESAQGENRAFE
jgi:hypothetical protein